MLMVNGIGSHRHPVTETFPLAEGDSGGCSPDSNIPLIFNQNLLVNSGKSSFCLSRISQVVLYPITSSA